MTRRGRQAPGGGLLLIGGHEDKTGDAAILREIAEWTHTQNAPLALLTSATELPRDYAEEYQRAFERVGITRIEHIDVRSRQDAHDDRLVQRLAQASVIFMTGGDQLRSVSQIGGTPLMECMRARNNHGALIAGTSAGAAAMPTTMLISGPSDSSNEADGLDMSPGLGLMSGVIVDTHFAQRGRMGRLSGAVARNPDPLGIGIDEDAALLVDQNGCARVLGSGAVYVVDGRGMSYTSLAEHRSRGIVSMHDLRVHILGAGQALDLSTRRPRVSSGDQSA
jgi:cyanophycinase